jgi:hypothetical protein
MKERILRIVLDRNARIVEKGVYPSLNVEDGLLSWRLNTHQ